MRAKGGGTVMKIRWAREGLEGFFRAYGTSFRTEDGARTFRGVLAPRPGEDGGRALAEPLGLGVQGRVLLMAPADAAGLIKGAEVWIGEQAFRVEQAWGYPVGGEILCRRAVLLPERGPQACRG